MAARTAAIGVVLAVLAIVAAADPTTRGGGCDPVKLTELASCVEQLLAGTMPGGDGLLRDRQARQGCCETVRRGVASGERCVCVFAKTTRRTNIIFFSHDAFELVCGDIRLQQHCQDNDSSRCMDNDDSSKMELCLTDGVVGRARLHRCMYVGRQRCGNVGRCRPAT